ALIGCIFVRKRKRPQLSPWIALIGIIISTGYIGVGAVNHERAVNIAKGTTEVMGEDIVRVEAYPKIGTVFVWRVVAETESAFLVGRISFLRNSDLHFRRLPKALNKWTALAYKHPEVQKYTTFAMGMLRPILVDGKDGKIVDFDDMRYALLIDSPRTAWSLRVRFAEDGRIIQVRPIRRRYGERPISQLIRTLWNEVWR
ncbi:MAG: hypothetical protein JSU92_04230, partial [Deltaproteobacteria bacterium]